MSGSIGSMPVLPQTFATALAKSTHVEQVMLAHLPAFPLSDLEALDTALTNERPLPPLFAALEPFRETIHAFLSRLIVVLKMLQALQAVQAVPVQQ